MLVKIKSTDLNKKTFNIIEKIKEFKNFDYIVTCLDIQDEDFERYEILCNKYKNSFDLFLIDITDDVIENKNELLQESILQFISCDKKLYLNWNSNKGEDFCKVINDLYKSENIKVIHNYQNPITKETLTNVNLKIFAEVFEEIVNGNLISVYLHTVKIDKEKLELFNGLNQTISIESVKLEEFDKKWKDTMLKVKRELMDFERYLLDNYYDYPFTFEVHEPIFDFNEGRIRDILDHKWKMFEFVSTLKYEDVLELPQEIILKLNENEFIPFNQILEIVEGDYPFLKYYKEMEGITI